MKHNNFSNIISVLLVFAIIFIFHFTYSLTVYTEKTKGKNGELRLSEEGQKGQLIFQNYNCGACHQIYGLGGYLGPDLTNAMSAPGKGELYSRAILQYGTNVMPDFDLSEEEIDALIAYFKDVDESGRFPIKYNEFNINWYGTVNINNSIRQ